MRWLLILFLVNGILGCQFSFQSIEFKKATSAEKSGHYKEAVRHYDRVIKHDPDTSEALKAAHHAAQISLFQTEDFASAIRYFHYIVVYSHEANDRREAEHSIAMIYFDKLNNYPKAIEEFSKLLALPHSFDDDVEYRFSMAKAYFYLNKFYQAKTEIDGLLKKKGINKRKFFEIKLFKGNILLTDKEIPAAIAVFEELQKDDQDLARKQKVGMSLAVCYEELNEFDKAIAVLEKVKKDYPSPEFVELKIKRLKRRKANLPLVKEHRK